MIEVPEFRMIELLSRDALEAHPAWADFHEEADRARILSWGVAPGRLDAEIERYDYCGRAPLYPVLDLAVALDLASPSIGLRFELGESQEGQGNRSLPGYRVGATGFGIYHGEDEYCLNPSLPARTRAELERLAAALERAPESLSRLRYESAAEFGRAGRIRGTLELG